MDPSDYVRPSPQDCFDIVKGLPKALIRPVSMSEYTLTNRGTGVVIRCHTMTDYDQAIWCPGKIRADIPKVRGESVDAKCESCGRTYRVMRLTAAGMPSIGSLM